MKAEQKGTLRNATRLISKGEACTDKGRLLLEDLQEMFLHRQRRNPELYDLLDLAYCHEMTCHVQTQLENSRESWRELANTMRKMLS